MRRLRISLRIIFNLQIICFQLVILHALPQATSPYCSSEQNTHCVNLANLASSLPINAACETLETIFHINCSMFEEKWFGIMDTTLGRPNLTAVPWEGARKSIIASWAWDAANGDLCQLRSQTVDMVPNKIDFSSSHVLIFDCDEEDNADMQSDSLACSNYTNDCGFVSATCVIENRTQRFKTLSCSSFTFLATGLNLSSTFFADWKGATLLVSLPLLVSGERSDKKGCNKSCKIAIGVSVPVVFIAIILLLVWIYYKRRPYYTRSFRNVSSNRILTERVHALSKKFGPVAAAEFSFAKLSKATNSFADENMIGDGGFGAVYLGVLKAGHKVAVKRLYHDNFKRIEHFYNEIRILSSLDHPNLVKLYGFCCQDQRDLLLVFEYASNGTVFDQLHDPERPPMPWSTRLNIARETAEALCYLHNSVSPPIYHRDVKTSNILLDDKLHVKLADFGLSRMVPLEASHVSTVPQGSPGYLDPDYHHCYQLTNKSDVYSFGVVLVELVSAKLAVDMSRDRREINLSSMALMKIGCGMWQDLVDPRLEMSENSQVERTVKQVLELSFLCLNEDKDSRPTIDYVVDVLRRLCKESGFDSHYDNSFLSMLDARHPLSVEDEGRQSIDVKSSSRSRNLTDFSLSSTDELNSQSSLL